MSNKALIEELTAEGTDLAESEETPLSFDLSLISDLLLKAAKALGRMEWRDIEIMPEDFKDGREVILGYRGEWFSAFYHDGTKCYPGQGHAGWFEECDRNNLLIAQNALATHWLPISAPQQNEERQ